MRRRIPLSTPLGTCPPSGICDLVAGHSITSRRSHEKRGCQLRHRRCTVEPAARFIESTAERGDALGLERITAIDEQRRRPCERDRSGFGLGFHNAQGRRDRDTGKSGSNHQSVEQWAHARTVADVEHRDFGRRYRDR